MQKNNSSQSKINITKDNNSQVTLDSNTLPRAQKEFYEKAKSINENEQRPFSFLDFKELKPNNFRHIIHKLKPQLEIVTKGHPTFYKIKGIELPGNSHRVTFVPMGLANNLVSLLSSLKDQPAKIHDIKIKVKTRIYDDLKSKGFLINPKNHGIIIRNIPVHDNNLKVHALIYPELIQIDVGCTYRPIVFDTGSLLYLSQSLSDCAFHIGCLAGAPIPLPVKDWIVTHYHLNKDGSYGIDCQDFHFTIGEVTAGMIRYYSKIMPDGTKIQRLEEIQTPQKPIFELIKKATMNNFNEYRFDQSDTPYSSLLSGGSA
jgi:hypothetical protein